jgi:hypothetical protein
MRSIHIKSTSCRTLRSPYDNRTQIFYKLVYKKFIKILTFKSDLYIRVDLLAIKKACEKHMQLKKKTCIHMQEIHVTIRN